MSFIKTYEEISVGPEASKKTLRFNLPKHGQELAIQAETARRLYAVSAMSPHYERLYDETMKFVAMSYLIEVIEAPDTWSVEVPQVEGESKNFLNPDNFYSSDKEYKEVRGLFSEFLNRFQEPEAGDKGVSESKGEDGLESAKTIPSASGSEES